MKKYTSMSIQARNPMQEEVKNNNQNRSDSEYADKIVIVKRKSAYCGMRKAERVSALPVPEYTCVRKTLKAKLVNKEALS